MTAPAFRPAHDPQFDGFLFALVGEDQKGMQVSVLSALARLGVDPRQEAQELAGLSENFARERLDALIARLPGVPSLIDDHRAIAERLIALLPQSAGVRTPTGTPEASGSMEARIRIFAFALLAIAVLIGQMLVSGQEPPAQDGGAGAPTSRSVTADR